VSAQIDRFDDRAFESASAIERDSFPESRPGGEFLREELARPWTRAWMARDGEVVVGYLLAWHVADELHILQVATAKPVRRQGIGARLVDAAMAYASREGVRLVLLEVRRSNIAAIALYRRAGFAVDRLRKGYYSNGEDALEMAVELDPSTGTRVARKDEVAPA
jgi:ribosomal-protein-alanine N-acetyltransferase